MKKLAEANHFDELTFYISRGDFSVIQSFVTLAFEKSFWLDFYCFSHSMSSWVDSASSFSFVSMSMSAETLKVTEGGLVELSASISAAPMDSKLLRTARTQPPQVIFGTLSDTVVISPVAVDDVLPPELPPSVAGVVDGAAGSPQPMMPTIMASARQESRLRI